MEVINISRRKKALILASFFAVCCIIAIFLVSRVSPLATWIDIGLYCRETKDSIPDGLSVRLIGQGYDVTERTVNGHVLFGSGLVDGTYSVSWYWNEPYERVVEINCSKITWDFGFCVPNPTITKHYKYDTPYMDYPAIVGLNVTLMENGLPAAWQLTDPSGTVVFDGNNVDVCNDYTLTWLWGSVPYSTDPIHFGYENGELLVCAWEETNYLPAKSGRDTMSIHTLADSVRYSC